jgi:DNA repair ATPase RecN
MIIRNLPIGAILFILMLSSAEAMNLYRFTDEEGVQSIGTSLPPNAAQRGYDILDAQSMRLIKRVAPALTSEEIEQLKREEAAKQLVAEQKKKQDIYDNRLLSLYQSSQDVYAAKQRDVEAKQATLEHTKLNLVELEARQQQYQQLAADEELGGGITAKTQQAITKNLQSIDETKQLINSLQKEILSLSAQYDADAERIKQLRY